MIFPVFWLMCFGCITTFITNSTYFIMHKLCFFCQCAVDGNVFTTREKSVSAEKGIDGTVMVVFNLKNAHVIMSQLMY